MKLLSDHRTFKVLALFWMALIFFLSSIPDLPAPSVFRAQDKIAHMLVFGILGFLFSRSFKPLEKDPGFRRVLLITLMVAVYGGLDESHQMFVPGREASLGDLAADIAARCQIRGCDAVYAALAQQKDAILVTLDRQQRERLPPQIVARSPAEELAQGSSPES